MRRLRPLDALFPKTRQAILAAIFVQPEKAWYISELARRIGVPASSLQRELHDLAAVGILTVRRQGRMVYYQANPNSPIFSDLRGLLVKTAGLVDILADALRPMRARIQMAFVFGSTASGSEENESDVDLLIVGTVSLMDLVRPLRRATELIGREINPVVYRPAEFDRKREAKDHFLTHVLGGPVLPVLGNVAEFMKTSRERRRGRLTGD